LERELQLIEPRKIVGDSPEMQEIKRFIEAVARDGNVTVLIRGETGTGKELVAHALHASGWRHHHPFVAVALTSLPTSTIESELFGHEAGAFTDARARRLGYIERAHRGVLFLDEIGDLPLEAQVKLLRFLEEREFQRVGSTEPIKVDVQVVAATNAELEARVQAGQFREDLYYRLKVHEIVLPPLRERADDIPMLVEHYLHLFRQRGKRVGRIAPDALQLLRHSSWPGNVRQLKNSIESAIFRAEVHGHQQIQASDLPDDAQKPASLTHVSFQRPGEANFDIYEALARTELAYVEKALQAARGKKSEAWKFLGYNDRETLYRRVRRILEQYPQLGQEFSHVSAQFGK
jgi:DNA-binding NtrC family response regulator